MDDTKQSLDVRQRLANVVKGHQEPKDRIWSAIIVLTFIAIGVGFISFVSWRSSEEGNSLTREGQQIGFQRGAVDCLTTVIDNDRNFDIPDYCRRTEVILWYPPEVCLLFFNNEQACGKKWGTG